MDFDYSPRTKELQAQAAALHGRAHLPGRAALRGRDRGQHQGRQALDAAADDRGAEAEGARAGPVEPVPAADRRRQGLEGERPRVRPVEQRLRAAAPRSWAACRGRREVFNCSAPDTGNMETIERYGSPEHKERWLRAAARRQDPQRLRDDRAGGGLVGRDQHRVAASSATATTTSSTAASGGLSGAGDPRCKIYIFMGKTDPEAPRHSQQSMVLVPADTPGIKVAAAAHRCSATTTRRTATWRSRSRTCACRSSNILLGEGRGFEIAQGRLGPGRIHHCMRLIGLAERALELMCKRASSRASRSAARSPSRASRASASPSRAA